jgi:hypothetical protein
MPPRGETVVVKGYRELLRASRQLPANSRRELRKAFRDAGELVRSDAASRFSPIDARSAAGYKVRVRQRGVAVEQSLRKTTGKHPQYGALQMRRALIPALDANEARTEHAIEEALDTVVRLWEL